MAIDWKQVAVTAVSSAAVAILSAALTARWALSRFRSERWWQMKVETYTATARALFLMKRNVDAWIYRAEMHTEHTEEYQQKLNEDWLAGARAVEEATVLGSFIISEDAAKVLEKLAKERARADVEDNPHDQATIEAPALEAAIRDFTAAARKDLGLPQIETTAIKRRQE
jgi:hypothetical protein